ncbi:hypothetical protein D8S78_07250 [Natrialba swarupiae]|nr:hypothetical protein [Natrialba swarupiae]
MSRHKLNKSNSTDFTMGELVDTFSEVLEDFEVVSKSDVEAMIDTKLSKAEEGGVGSIEDVEETKAEATPTTHKTSKSYSRRRCGRSFGRIWPGTGPTSRTT